MSEGLEPPTLPPESTAPPPTANADNWAVTRNALTGYLAWGLNLATGFIVTPIVLRRLGANGFGAWTLSLTIAGYVIVAELGLGVATTRFLASALATGDERRASAIASSARAIYLGIAALGGLVLIGLVFLPGLLTEATGVSSTAMRLAVLALGLGYVAILAISIYPTIAVGAGRTDLGMIIGSAWAVATAGAQVTAVLLSRSIVPLAVVTAVGMLAGTVAIRTVARRRFAGIDVRLGNANRRAARELLTSGSRNAALGIFAAMAIQSDVLVVGAIVGPVAVAAYGIAIRASTAVSALAGRATSVLVPTFAHSTTAQQTDRTVNVLRESIFLTRAMVTPALIALIAFGQPLLRLWLGNVPPHAHEVLVLLVLGIFIAAPGGSAVSLMTGMNRLNFVLAGAALTAAVNLGVSIALTYRYGIIGPVLGSIVGYLAWDTLVLPRFVGKVLEIPWWPIATSALGSLLVAAAAASATAWAIVDGFGWRSPGAGLGGALAVCAVYAAVLWFTLDERRRDRYRFVLTNAAQRSSRAGRFLHR